MKTFNSATTSMFPCTLGGKITGVTFQVPRQSTGSWWWHWQREKCKYRHTGNLDLGIEITWILYNIIMGILLKNWTYSEVKGQGKKAIFSLVFLLICLSIHLSIYLSILLYVLACCRRWQMFLGTLLPGYKAFCGCVKHLLKKCIEYLILLT